MHESAELRAIGSMDCVCWTVVAPTCASQRGCLAVSVKASSGVACAKCHARTSSEYHSDYFIQDVSDLNEFREHIFFLPLNFFTHFIFCAS